MYAKANRDYDSMYLTKK